MRIVSLFPSATEIVVDLGLADRLVGISHQCTWPPSVQHLPRVTRSAANIAGSPREISLAVGRLQASGLPVYHVEHARIAALQPDVVLTQNVCDVCAVPEQAAFEAVAQAAPAATALTLGAERLQDIMDNLQRVGDVLGVPERTGRILEAMNRRLDAIRRQVAGRPRPRVLIIEWVEPIIGSGHWLPDLVRVAGGVNLLSAAGEASRVIPWQEVLAAQPEVLLVIPCGRTLDEAVADALQLAERPGWRQLTAVQAGRVFVLDGSVCSRHGSRIIDVAETFAQLLHPAAAWRRSAPVPFVAWADIAGQGAR